MSGIKARTDGLNCDKKREEQKKRERKVNFLNF